MRHGLTGREPLNIPGLEVLAQCCPVCRHFGTTVLERSDTTLLTACPACGGFSMMPERRYRDVDRRCVSRDTSMDRRRAPLALA